MIEALSFILLRKDFPAKLCSLKKAESSHYVCPCKSERILDRTVHVRLRSKVNDSVYSILLHEIKHLVKIADVRLDEHIVRLVFDILQIGEITRICQFVHIDYTVIRVLVYKKSHHVATDESGSSCDDYVSLEIHYMRFLIHFLSESVQYGTLIPKVFLILVLSSTE